jgi:hypothetical protein
MNFGGTIFNSNGADQPPLLFQESGAKRGLAMNQILRRSIGRGALGMKS